jgi:hypothetical protein
MTGIKRWRWVVLDPALDRLGSCMAGNFGSNSESKIDARGNTTRGDCVAVSNDPGLIMRGSNERQ